jgi:diaminohydroxyphosphoribosylaminopyrimidine deaminase/5-amino-6-(5-phosphoribosylamino)uracil reductase
MQRALEEARRGTGLTSPNPCVGAVIVRDGELLATGWHRRAGGPHAEIEALRAATAPGPHAVRGATLFVTLEPCSTTGRTPPCVDAIAGAGIARVVWGADDPDPRHAGRARSLLEAAGVRVDSGIRGAECEEIIAPFRKRITTGLPWVIAKAGMSLDGRITRPAGEGSWITGEAARADAMKLRARCDAIIVGAETIRQDDPALTLRGPEIEIPEGREQPWRVVLTRTGNLPAAARVFTDAHRHRTLVMKDRPLESVLRDLAGRGAMSVLIEGGGTVLAEVFASRLADEAVLYVAPLLCGAGRPVIAPDIMRTGSCGLEFVSARMVGPDLRLQLRIPQPP